MGVGLVLVKRTLIKAGWWDLEVGWMAPVMAALGRWMMDQLTETCPSSKTSNRHRQIQSRAKQLT